MRIRTAACRLRTVLAAGLVAISACATSPRGWDLASLEARHPQVAEVAGHQLRDAIPYFAPAEDGLALVLCRWSTAEPIAVWVPPYASPDEIRAIELALQAWEDAGLGVHFDVNAWAETPPQDGIVFEIVDARAGGLKGAADTIADCAVPEQAEGGERGETPVDAELHYASIHLRRELRNEIGRAVPLTDVELLGALVHEMGHALGFPGHVSRPGTLMSAHGQVGVARRSGRRLQQGDPLEAPTLSALYAVPSGVRVGWLPLTASQQRPLDRVSATAVKTGLRGPWVRVGGASARILWRRPDGQSAAVVVLDWSAALREPERFEARLNRLARLLVESGDR